MTRQNRFVASLSAPNRAEADVLTDRVEGKWIECFARVFALCKIGQGDEVAILSETQSRRINVELSELALHRLGARAFHVVVPMPRLESIMPIRSTGASNAVLQLQPVIRALSSCVAVIDNTVEGMLHSVELAEILSGGARLFMISNEHPEILERLMPIPELRAKVEAGAAMMRSANEMRIISDAGTDLVVDMRDAARIGGNWGFNEAKSSVSHWPGGLCACYPRAGMVNGTVVMNKGDVNLTFKRYLEAPITMRLENDFITEIKGENLDADLMRSYFAGWNDRNAYASAHLGWGMNPIARWDALTMYDKADTNGTELRVFAGNFLFSTGANKFANRYTLGHFDLPMRNCSVMLDGKTVVDKGKLIAELTV
jgi:2,5-dihydroxypyridine 5,6-dioxygenase